ncbi:EAL domain-containing protein [Rhizobium binxianense]
MAFQPIVDIGAGGAVFAYEALVRGPAGQGADKVFSDVSPTLLNAFDEVCRSRAIDMAASLGMASRLSLNVSASAICDRRHGLHASLRRARKRGWPIDNLIFEMTEHDPVSDLGKLGRWIAAARTRNVKVAIDDFGAGYAGLSRLLTLRPEIIKLDLALVRNIDTDRSRQALVKGVVDACRSFDCTVIAEGVETDREFFMLSQLDVTLMQGFLFAKPGLASLPAITLPMTTTTNEMPDHEGTYQ